VLTNATLYFVTTMVLVKIVAQRDAPAARWLVVVPTALFAAIYGWLLMRGPAERDVESQRR